MTKQRTERLRHKIQDARCRLIQTQPYFALMLMYLRFIAVPGMQKISTNGKCIYFNPDFLEKLTEHELDYILCHQILHIVLKHIWRSETNRGDNYHFACNIQINSILEEQGILPKSHSHLGYLKTLIPGPEKPGKDFQPEEILAHSFYKISMFDERTRGRYMEDSDCFWDRRKDSGKGGILILDIPPVEPLVRTEEDKENPEAGKESSDGNAERGSEKVLSKSGEFHCESSPEDEQENDDEVTETDWEIRTKAASMLLYSSGEESDILQTDNVPGFLKRIIQMKHEAVLDWRELLSAFIQEQISDYSFSPPDRRFSETDFFLPDFNEKDYSVKDILFMVDTSGSVSDEDLGDVYSEICAACEQFAGKLSGKISFFDAGVTEPVSFSSVEDVLAAIPCGNGGTDFRVIFDFVRENYAGNYPSCIIVFSDGMGPYPEEADTMGIPVMWVLTDEYVTPPFGKVIRLIEKQRKAARN